MGRKGLGKLSRSRSRRDRSADSEGGTVHGLRMCVSGIQQAVKNKQPYHPTELLTAAPSIERGTKIVLRDIKRQRLGKGVTALRKRLARRFSIIGQTSGFEITIDGAPITAADRGDLPKAQFLWTFEGYEPEAETIAHVKEREVLPARFEAWDPTWRVTVGSAPHASQGPRRRRSGN